MISALCSPYRKWLLARISPAAPEPVALVLLNMGANRILLAECSEAMAGVSVELPLGYRGLADACFAHWPSAPVELERAIDLIEGHLSDMGSPPHGAMLIGTEGIVNRMFARRAPDIGGVTDWGRDDVELALQDLASVSLGRPASRLQWVRDNDEAAALLLLRELMRHLDFARLIVRSMKAKKCHAARSEFLHRSTLILCLMFWPAKFTVCDLWAEAVHVPF